MKPELLEHKMWQLVPRKTRILSIILPIAAITIFMIVISSVDPRSIARSLFFSIGLVGTIGLLLGRQWAWNLFCRIPFAKSFFPNVHGVWIGELTPHPSTGDKTVRKVAFKIFQNWKAINIVSESKDEGIEVRSFIGIPIKESNQKKLIYTLYKRPVLQDGALYFGASEISINEAVDTLTVVYVSNRPTGLDGVALGAIRLTKRSPNPSDTISWC